MINEIATWLKGTSVSKTAKTIPFEGFDRTPFEGLHVRGRTYKSNALGQALMESCLTRVKSISDVELLTDDLCFRIDPFASPDLLRKLFASRLTNAFFSMTMFDLYEAINGKVIYYIQLHSKAVFYRRGQDYELDEAISRLRDIEIRHTTTYWSLVDALFCQGFLEAAEIAQRFAMSTVKKPDAFCTLCAKVESPGFYTGCLLNDGEDVPPCEYTCDGNGNLFLKRSQ